MTTVHDAVNDLACAFEEFKSANNERLASFEKTGSVDPLIEQKLSRLNEVVDRTYQNLDKLQMSFSRPNMSEGRETFSFGEQERKAAFLHYVRNGDDSKIMRLEEKSLTTGSDKDGGYFIPQLISDHIHRELINQSPIRALASVITISSSAVELLIDKENAEVGWVGETAERNETQTPDLAKVRILVHEIFANPRASQILLDDARVNVEEWLAHRISTRMAQVENQAFIFGNGNTKPKGFLDYPTCARKDLKWGCIEQLNTGEFGGFGPESSADILFDTIQAMKAEYQKGAVWLMSPSAHASIRKLKDRNGHYVWQPGLGLDATASLVGYKVIIVDDMPDLSPKEPTKSIVFANLKEGYQIVDRAGVKILRDPYTAKPYVLFYTTKRVGGDVINFDAFKIVNFSKQSK